jgi:hypothetical protein
MTSSSSFYLLGRLQVGHVKDWRLDLSGEFATEEPTTRVCADISLRPHSATQSTWRWTLGSSGGRSGGGRNLATGLAKLRTRET